MACSRSCFHKDMLRAQLYSVKIISSKITLKVFFPNRFLGRRINKYMKNNNNRRIFVWDLRVSGNLLRSVNSEAKSSFHQKFQFQIGENSMQHLYLFFPLHLIFNSLARNKRVVSSLLFVFQWNWRISQHGDSLQWMLNLRRDHHGIHWGRVRRNSSSFWVL